MTNTLNGMQAEAYSKGSAVRRSIGKLLAPIDEIAVASSNILANREARFQVKGEEYFLPRFLFIGPKSGDVPIHLGLFAGIHGDEPEGAYALVRFLHFLEINPELAAGYMLSIYPLCNPTGFEDNTRHSRSGKDLDRQFWTKSREPEIRLLEAELVAQSFDGIISLHSDPISSGFHLVVGGATLTRHLIEPALRAADEFLPLDQRGKIDGVSTHNSIVRETSRGILSAPPRVNPRPFEIILKTPKGLPVHRTECAFGVALQTILAEYRKLMAFAPNL